MKITALRSQKRNSHRISVYLDGGFARSLTLETVQALGLAEGMEIDREEFDRICRADESLRARDYALLLLSYKARTVAELRTRLASKGFSPAAIDSTLRRLAELNLVNDEQFARRFAEDRIRLGRKGKWRVRAELTRRGVSREQIEQALAEAPDELTAARAAARQFCRRNQRLEPAVLRRRLYGFLARRGFSPDTISSVIDQPEEDD